MCDMHAYMYICLVFKMHSYDRCVSYIPKIVIESMCVCVCVCVLQMCTVLRGLCVYFSLVPKLPDLFNL